MKFLTSKSLLIISLLTEITTQPFLPSPLHRSHFHNLCLDADFFWKHTPEVLCPVYSPAALYLRFVFLPFITLYYAQFLVCITLPPLLPAFPLHPVKETLHCSVGKLPKVKNLVRLIIIPCTLLYLINVCRLGCNQVCCINLRKQQRSSLYL